MSAAVDAQSCASGYSDSRWASECVACDVPRGRRCHNRSLQRQTFPSTSIRAAGEKGDGLFADAPIVADVTVIEYTGKRVVGERALQRAVAAARASPRGMCYLMRLEGDVWLDARNTRFKAGRINHSCAPNCRTAVFQVPEFAKGRFLRYTARIAVVSSRRLARDEELTIDYNWRSVDGAVHACCCGAKSCRGKF